MPASPLTVDTLASWLAGLPHANPPQVFAALAGRLPEIAAVGDPAQRLDLFDRLRAAAHAADSALAGRLLRKPLPLTDDEARLFGLLAAFWLDIATHSAALAGTAQGGRALHRAASALRRARLIHFQAAQALPPEAGALLGRLIGAAAASGQFGLEIADPAAAGYDDGTLGGQLAWLCLLQAADPYALSAPQLAVTNRALRRWRELCAFVARPSADALDLGQRLGDALPDGAPHWLDARKLRRKIGERLTALSTGQTPDELKLGRELSTAACQRLLHELDGALFAPGAAPATADGSLRLVFGSEEAYALLSGRRLRPEAETRSAHLRHQRIAVFGFDHLSTLPHAVQRLNVDSEIWQCANGMLHRPFAAGAARRQSPCLVALAGETPCLGILRALRQQADGSLSGRLALIVGTVGVHVHTPPGLDPNAQPQAAFLIADGERRSLLLPAGGALRPGLRPLLDGQLAAPLGEVIERGSDFVRYALSAG